MIHDQIADLKYAKFDQVANYSPEELLEIDAEIIRLEKAVNTCIQKET
jgi:hypothetical protein